MKLGLLGFTLAALLALACEVRLLYTALYLGLLGRGLLGRGLLGRGLLGRGLLRATPSCVRCPTAHHFLSKVHTTHFLTN